MTNWIALPPHTGLLASAVGVDAIIAVMGSAGTVEEITANLQQAPSGGSVRFQIRDDVGGGGNGVEVIIPDGSNGGPFTVNLPFAAGATLYRRVVAESGFGMSLTGNIRVQLSSPSVSPVPAFTTLQRVKQHLGTTDAGQDTYLTELIAAVSTDFAGRLGSGMLTAQTWHRFSASGISHAVPLPEYPISSVDAVRFYGEDQDPADFVLLGDGRVAYMPGGVAVPLPRGVHHIEIQYTHGYASMPEDLVQASTKQVIHEYRYSVTAGTDYLGKTERADGTTGATVGLHKRDYAEGVLAVLDRYIKPRHWAV